MSFCCHKSQPSVKLYAEFHELPQWNAEPGVNSGSSDVLPYLKSLLWLPTALKNKDPGACQRPVLHAEACVCLSDLAFRHPPLCWGLVSLLSPLHSTSPFGSTGPQVPSKVHRTFVTLLCLKSPLLFHFVIQLLSPLQEVSLQHPEHPCSRKLTRRLSSSALTQGSSLPRTVGSGPPVCVCWESVAPIRAEARWAPAQAASCRSPLNTPGGWLHPWQEDPLPQPQPLGISVLRNAYF